MKLWKRTVRKAVKVVAGIAALAFVVANPLSSNGSAAIAFFISVPVLLLCLFIWLLVGGADDSGYWPEKPPER